MASEMETAGRRAQIGPEILDGRTPIADRIRERIRKAGDRFHANDNICSHVEAGELEQLQAEVEMKMLDVLRTLVIDTEHRAPQRADDRRSCHRAQCVFPSPVSDHRARLGGRHAQ